MGRTTLTIDAPPARVFDVLSDPESYGVWVVGSKQVRDADADFPAPGSRFHHTVGFGPITVSDHTVVEEMKRPQRIKLRAKARPLGTTHVTLELKRKGRSKTEVTMTEGPADPLSALVFYHPLTHLLVRGRNDESLRRLAELAAARG
ncbi:MAG: SRPBCC family protein [Actinomycetota bacterium]|nr:SRPBCC family protein [Actinomycetota bacterium]